MSFDLWSFVFGLFVGLVAGAEHESAFAGAARVFGAFLIGAALTWGVLR